MNDSVTYKEVYELVEKLRTEILSELRLQRAEHIAPLTDWQRQHEEFHRNERKMAWKAAAWLAGFSLAVGGLVMGIIERATS